MVSFLNYMEKMPPEIFKRFNGGINGLLL